MSIVLSSADGDLGNSPSVDATHVLNTTNERRKATLMVATLANNVQECADVLGMLGLHPDDARM